MPKIVLVRVRFLKDFACCYNKGDEASLLKQIVDVLADRGIVEIL